MNYVAVNSDHFVRIIDRMIFHLFPISGQFLTHINIRIQRRMHNELCGSKFSVTDIPVARDSLAIKRWTSMLQRQIVRAI